MPLTKLIELAEHFDEDQTGAFWKIRELVTMAKA
jgi:hypothetical protein